MFTAFFTLNPPFFDWFFLPKGIFYQLDSLSITSLGCDLIIDL